MSGSSQSVRNCRYDEKNHERFPVGDPNKRAFTYFVLTGARFMYASAMRLVVLKFLLSWAVRFCWRSLNVNASCSYANFAECSAAQRLPWLGDARAAGKAPHSAQVPLLSWRALL